MSFIKGFRVSERLYESDNSLVFRGTRETDGEAVIIKLLNNDFPTLDDLARYRREFEITNGLELPGVIRSYELHRHEKTLMMVLEDFGGLSIADLLRQRRLSLDEFLDAALQIAGALEHMHRAQVIHKDISPDNLVINPATGEVKIVDFGIATRFSTEQPALESPEVLQGTLAYMSPEQTGRMNRSLDYRSDFYSLGATFYEMLTGNPPFDADDKMEMVHCHIAREPIPPHRLNTDVPLALSKIIGRLMAKKAEDRYQSAAGLIADLEAVRLGDRIERFEPGRFDSSERFQIPERLYGREKEVETLLEAFDRVRRGRAEMMLVAGYSGIGKSALVHEVHKPITRARGYFIAGKFDQFQRNEPYSGLMAALRDLVRQLLTESEAGLAAWRKDLNEALAPNAQVIIDVLPELELVIGAQPPVAELGGAEATNRFNRAIGQLLRALCARERVIVLFLDDLQWADTATLGLLRVMLTDDKIRRLLLIGAYRDNEVDGMHPLKLALREIRDGGGQVSSLTLAPLALGDVARMIGDALKADATELMALARLVVQKTQGNPFFVRQFLKDLYQQGLITQEHGITGRARWQWDLAAIRAAGITDNVVDLLLGKLRRLPAGTQEFLRVAACIGTRFDIDTLAQVMDSDRHSTFRHLRPAVDEGLLQPLSELTQSEGEDLLSPLLVREFAFQHDRVQEAAYGLIEEERQAEIHLTIGRRLRDVLTGTTAGDKIFEVVDHLNIGRALITDEAERLDLAGLNLEAARKASDATAHPAALSLIRVAQDLVGPEGWERQYALTFDIHREWASLEYLNGNFERCSEIVGTTLDHAKSDLEKAEVYFTRIAQHTLLAEFPQAIEAGYRSLSHVGIDLPRENLQEAGQQAIGRAMAMLGEGDPADIYDMPDATNPEMLLAQKSLRHLTIAAFLANQELFPLIVGTSVRLSLEHGHAPDSALSFANLGLILGAFMGEYRAGLAFGELAMRLCERFAGEAPTATVCLVHGTELVPWVRHARESLQIIDRGYVEGLNSGDILWAGYLLMYRVLYDTFIGRNIDEILEGIPDQLDFTNRTQNRGAVAGIQAHQIVLSTLAGQSNSSTDFMAEGIDEASFLESCDENQLSMALCLYKILKAQAHYIFGRPSEALEATREVEGMLSFIVNHPNLADHLLYQSLSIAALHVADGSEKAAAEMDQLRANLGRFETWAESCPDNFLAKKLLVEAEIARLNGERAEAADLYDRAIVAAHSGEFMQDEALANELAARFVMTHRPSSRVGAMYLRDAAYAYRLWGAARKVEELELEFPQLLTEYRDRRGTRQRGMTETRQASRQSGSSEEGGAILDLDTLTKAGQTISGEVVLERLLERMLGILIENAGAQRGVLLLARDETLYIEAEASVVSDEVGVLMSIPIDTEDGAAMVPQGVIHFAARTREVVVVDDAQQDERFMSDPYVQKRTTRSVLCQPIVNQGDLIGLVYLENDLSPAAFTPERARLLSLLSGQVAISIRNAELVENLEDKVRERTEQLEMHSRFIEQTFGRYLSNEIADRLLRSPDGLDFRGQKQTVTVLMSDIRGFTTFSDHLPPETIVKLLNNYLSEMTAVIQKYNGTIDAFIGDAILTIFGAPLPRPDDAERGVACALEMQMAMPRVNAWNRQHGLPDIQMGIGVNTGEVVVGNIGSHRRAKYGAVGSNVNVAARIEGYTVGGQILISEGTRNAVRAPMTLKDAGTAQAKGVAEPIALYQLEGLGGGHELELPRLDVERLDIDPPIPVTYRLIVDKKVVDEPHHAALLSLSALEARVHCQQSPGRYADVRLHLPREGDRTEISIYGKVLDEATQEGIVLIRFTAIPPDARQHLEEMGL